VFLLQLPVELNKEFTGKKIKQDRKNMRKPGFREHRYVG